MKTSIYIKLIRYFIGLILITCLACAALFFLTMGRPIAGQAHQLVKNHVRFIAGQVEHILIRNDPGTLNRFLKEAGQAYGMDLTLFNEDMNPLARFPLNASPAPKIRTEMRAAVEKQGRWVQSGHLSGSTIYLLPVAGPGNTAFYLYLSKASATLMPLVLFLTGLLILCLLLILAIYPLARSFTRPIRRLSDHLEQMAAGRFSAADIRPVRQDELGRLEETYMKMAASVKEMMASKKRLLADISHELRSPLGRMEVSAELLTDTCRESGNRDGIRQTEVMAAEIRSMTGLVRALSEYAKINLPEFKLNLEFTEPGALIRDLFNRNRDIMEKRGLSLGLDNSEELPQLRLDPDHILIVLQNFVDNAMQQSPKGGQITLGALKTDEGVRFFVSDSGPGIAPKYENQIFDPLFRTDSSRNRHTGGLGLGLAISRRITALHGGQIRYTRENERTVFSIDLTTDA